MPTRRQETGASGEDAAAEALRRAGYEILERNLRTPLGEIDVLAWEDDVLCVIEVKARADDRFGSPLEAVTPAKQAKLKALANALLQQPRFQHAQIRFDVVAVTAGEDGQPAIEILPDAFQ